MTISEHIDTLKMLIKQTSDDTHYTDEFLYKLLLDARALLIYQQLQKKVRISQFNYQTFCIQLTPATYHDCGTCIPDVGCRILKGTQKLPKPLKNKYKDFMRILTITGDAELIAGTGISSRLLKFSNTMKNQWMYEIVNEKPIVWGVSGLEYILVQAILEDPSDALELCTQSGEQCFTPETDDFPVASELHEGMYELVMKRLFPSLQIVDDNTNNAESKENERRQTNPRK